MNMKKTFSENRNTIMVALVIAIAIILCMMGFLRQWGIDCCQWTDDQCKVVEQLPGGTQTIVEECASCEQTTYPNCAGECSGSTEQLPIICQPYYDITGQMRCKCLEWYGYPPV